MVTRRIAHRDSPRIEVPQLPLSFSADSTSLLVRETSPKTGRSLNVIRLSPSGEAGQSERLVSNTFAEPSSTTTPASIVVVEHWTEELKQKLSSKYRQA